MNILLENLQNMTKHIYEQYEYHTAITDIGQNSSKTNKRQTIQIWDKTQVKQMKDKLYRYWTKLK